RARAQCGADRAAFGFGIRGRRLPSRRRIENIAGPTARSGTCRNVTTSVNLRIIEGLATDAANDDVANDDWVLSFDLAELGRALPECVRWEELGPLRGFFQGVLFDREALAGASQPDCSNAKLVLHAYAREGEAALSRLRGSFVVALVDGARSKAILARD